MAWVLFSHRRLDRRFNKAFGFPAPETDEEREARWGEVVARLKNAVGAVRAAKKEFEAGRGNGQRGLSYIWSLRRAELAKLKGLAHKAGYPLEDIEEMDEMGRIHHV